MIGKWMLALAGGGLLLAAGCAGTDGFGDWFEKRPGKQGSCASSGDCSMPGAQRRDLPPGAPGTEMPVHTVSERDPMGPMQKGQTGVHVDPFRFQEARYSPDTLAQRIAGRSFQGLTRQTFAEAGGDYNVDVDRTGTRMLYATTRYSQTPKICVQQVHGSAVTLVTDGTMSDMMPRFSPDGQLVAWSSNRYGNWDVLVKRTDSSPESRPQQITRSGDDDVHPAWSQDARLLAFSRFNSMDGQWQLWVMDYRTRRLNYITEGLFPTFRPIPEKNREGETVYTLAYQRHRQRDVPWYSLWTITVRMGDNGAVQAVRAPTEIVASDQWAAITPAWKPDGEYLAFAAVRKSPLAQWQARIYKADDIWVVKLDGTELTQITSHSAPDWNPAWAHDENSPTGRIFFTSLRSGTPNVWSVRPLLPGMLPAVTRTR